MRRERAGRLRLALISDASEETLGAFLTRNVEAKSRVRTDGWRGYSEAAVADYIHHVRTIGPSERAHRRFPHIHRVFSNLKTWLNGTHHGVEPKHLPSYPDEFVFRFNRRNTPMAAFQTLLGISLLRRCRDEFEGRSPLARRGANARCRPVYRRFAGMRPASGEAGSPTRGGHRAG